MLPFFGNRSPVRCSPCGDTYTTMFKTTCLKVLLPNLHQHTSCGKPSFRRSRQCGKIQAASQWETFQTRALKSGKIGDPVALYSSPFHICLQSGLHHPSNETLVCFTSFHLLSQARLQSRKTDSSRCKKRRRKRKQTVNRVQSLCYHALVNPSSHHPQSACFHCAGASFWDQTVGRLWGSCRPKRQFLHQLGLWKHSFKIYIWHWLPWK